MIYYQKDKEKFVNIEYLKEFVEYETVSHILADFDRLIGEATQHGCNLIAKKEVSKMNKDDFKEAMKEALREHQSECIARSPGREGVY
jgi:hypothetical protein